MMQEIFPSSVSVIGSTGSVGTQAMEIVAENKIAVDLLSADRNVALAEEQIRRFSPRRFVCGFFGQNNGRSRRRGASKR